MNRLVQNTVSFAPKFAPAKADFVDALKAQNRSARGTAPGRAYLENPSPVRAKYADRQSADHISPLQGLNEFAARNPGRCPGLAYFALSALTKTAPLFLICCLMLLSVSASAAADAPWPMFRGNAALTGIANETLPDKPVQLWSFKTEGPVKSSPIIAEGKIFIGSDDMSVYALNFADGKKVWSFKTEGAVESTPCYADGVVYVGSNDMNVYALNAADGTLKWKYKTDGEVKAGPTINKGVLMIGSYDNKLHSVDAATGKAQWTFQTDNYVNGSTGTSDGKAAFGGCDGMVHVLDSAQGKEIKAVEAGSYIAASAALYKGIAYVGTYDNAFIAVDLTKVEVLWKYKSKREFAFVSSPAVNEDVVVFGGRDKQVHCLDRATGKDKWIFTARGKVDSSPVIAGDKVIVGSDDGRVYILWLKNGMEAWSYEIGAQVDGSAAVAKGVFVMGAADGGVYAFGAK